MLSTTATMTTQDVASRFNELAKQEKWFEIQDELFSDDVKSIEPAGSKYLHSAEGKSVVRRKAEDFVKRIEGVQKLFTTEPIVAENHFVVGREKDLTVNGIGKVYIHELMLYEVRDGKIVSEQFFY